MSQPTDTAEKHILRSWRANATPWIGAIRAGSIASRKGVTDRAIVEAVARVAAARVLDLGCGEGWLARALGARGLEVTGIDAIPSLIDEARRLGGADFQVQDYDDIARRRFRGGPFDTAVCNFSLFGHESVELLLGGVGGYLAPQGALVVQTLHPLAACGDQGYRDGWRAGHWTGFGAELTDPAPWYFRTLESWVSMLDRCGFDLLDIREPTAAGASAPSSVIFTCRRSTR